MDIKDIQGKQVAVLGYGLEGKAVVRFLLKHGVEPTIFDHKLWEEWPPEEREHIQSLGINFISGHECFKQLSDFDIAFRSPGIKLSQIKSYKLQVTSQTKWFFEHCPGKIIGVTGTKGKGTTSALIYEMLKESKVFLTGNIGKDQPLDFLDNLSRDYWVIYELSSFQLQDLGTSPHIGVVLMVTSEHLDYHQDNQEYISAKEPIVKFQTAQDFAIVNADFEASMSIGNLAPGKKFFFSRKKTVEPGCFVKNGMIWFSNSAASPDSHKVAEICKTDEVALRGEHNLENICAAALAAHCAGADFKSIKRAAIEFKGLEHRLEFSGEKNEVKFYNDSFSTTPETAIAAIKSFSEPLILILGGSSKNADFTELGQTVVAAKNIKALILVGDEAEKIKSAIGGRASEIQVFEGAKNMPEIFEQVKSAAASGDVVLLSPACASFDMFENYKDRGEQFKEGVEKFN